MKFQTIFFLFIVMFLSGCKLGPFSWTEKITTNSHIIEVKRIVPTEHCGGELGGGGTFKMCKNRDILKFKNPIDAQEIKWEGESELIPIALHIVNNEIYLTTHGIEGFQGKYNVLYESNKYRCPQIPFATFKHANGVWNLISQEEVPEKARKINLSIDFSRVRYEMEVNQKYRFYKDDIESNIKGYLWHPKLLHSNRIPKNFSEWENPYKERFKNKRYKIDCREEPNTKNPKVIMPRYKTNQLKPDKGFNNYVRRSKIAILEKDSTKNTRKYKILMTKNGEVLENKWKELHETKDVDESCKKITENADWTNPKMDGWTTLKFAKDKSLVFGCWNGMYNSCICSDSAIWHYQYFSSNRRDNFYTHAIISKVHSNGELDYTFTFKLPEKNLKYIRLPLSGYKKPQKKFKYGFIDKKSIREEGGFLKFNWLTIDRKYLANEDIEDYLKHEQEYKIKIKTNK